ncbi:hypothetical protein BHE74_00028785, partial [Ensete ventricosum]
NRISYSLYVRDEVLNGRFVLELDDTCNIYCCSSYAHLFRSSMWFSCQGFGIQELPVEVRGQFLAPKLDGVFPLFWPYA